MAGDQATSDPRGHLATCGTCAGLFPRLRPGGRHSCPPALRLSPAQVYPVFSLLGALLGAARRASPRTPCPGPRRFFSASPLPAPSSAPPPPTSAPAKANPRTCQSPILASMDIASRRSRRRIPAGHGLEGSAWPAPWNRLGKSFFFLPAHQHLTWS